MKVKRRSELISADIYHLKRGGYFQERRLVWLQKQFLQNISMDRPLTILEIGTGTGGMINKLAELYPHWKFWGADISEEYLRFAGVSANHVSNCAFTLADAEISLPFSGVDLVISFDVLHHFINLDAGIRTISAALKPNGAWFAVEPNFLNPYIFCFQFLTSGEANFLPWVAESLFRNSLIIKEKSHFYLIPSVIQKPPSLLLQLEAALEFFPLLAGAISYVLIKRDILDLRKV